MWKQKQRNKTLTAPFLCVYCFVWPKRRNSWKKNNAFFPFFAWDYMTNIWRKHTRNQKWNPLKRNQHPLARPPSFPKVDLCIWLIFKGHWQFLYIHTTCTVYKSSKKLKQHRKNPNKCLQLYTISTGKSNRQHYIHKEGWFYIFSNKYSWCGSISK